MRYVWFLVLASSLQLAAQNAPAAAIGTATEPRIKGHRVGETITDWLTVEKGDIPAVKASLDECRVALADQKRYSRVKQIESDGRGTLKAEDITFASHVDHCVAVAKAVSGKDAILFEGKSDAPGLASPKYVFSKQALVSIQLEIAQTFDKVLIDLRAKFGPEDLINSAVQQNSYGAAWANQQAVWSHGRGDTVVLAGELKPNPNTLIGTVVLVKDGAYARSQTEHQPSSSNSLDR